MADRPIHRISPEGVEMEMDDLAEEVVITIYCDDEVVVRILATPSDLEDLAIGHIACEGRGTIDGSRVEENSVYLSGSVLSRPSGDLLTAACGACTEGEIEDVEARVTNTFKLGVEPFRLCNEMRGLQPVFSATGGVHAAALANSQQVVLVREDIGRHNAVDKVIGAAITAKLDPSEHCLILSGRIGWELVAKAARVGIELMISVGAVSTAAADLARSCGMTLVGFTSEGKGVVIGPTSRIIDKLN